MVNKMYKDIANPSDKFIPRTMYTMFNMQQVTYKMFNLTMVEPGFGIETQILIYSACLSLLHPTCN